MNRSIAFTCAVLAIGACGSPPEPVDERDAGVVADGAPATDAATQPDAASSCATPGETRASACGMCGMQGEQCSPTGTWEPTSMCLNQGMCMPGAVDNFDGIFCNHQQRLCRNDCTWGDWADTVPQGECEPGQTDCSYVPNHLCNDMCHWVESPC